MISVIVPVYNVRPYLREAVESILRQTYTELEIILIDDGSTDGSGEICDEYRAKDHRIRVVHQENRGLSAARNAGLDICRAEAVAFLDSDDVFLPETISKMLEAMQHSGADIVECNFVEFENGPLLDGSEIERMPKGRCPEKDRTGLYSMREDLLMSLGGELAAYAWNKLYRRSIWDELRYREGQNYEDLDIVLPVLERAESVYILDEKLVMHRMRQDSITANKSFENIRDRLLAFRHYYEYVCDHTPEYFSRDDCEDVLNRNTRRLIQLFKDCACGDMDKKKERLRFLRGQLSVCLGETDLRKESLRFRTICRLLERAPLFVSVPVYRLSRRFSPRRK